MCHKHAYSLRIPTWLYLFQNFRKNITSYLIAIFFSFGNKQIIKFIIQRMAGIWEQA